MGRTTKLVMLNRGWIFLFGISQVGSSFICGSGGNFSSISDWSIIGGKLMIDLDDPLDYKTVVSRVSEVVEWVNDRNYWLEELECVQELIAQVLVVYSCILVIDRCKAL